MKKNSKNSEKLEKRSRLSWNFKFEPFAVLQHTRKEIKKNCFNKVLEELSEALVSSSDNLSKKVQDSLILKEFKSSSPQSTTKNTKNSRVSWMSTWLYSRSTKACAVIFLITKILRKVFIDRVRNPKLKTKTRNPAKLSESWKTSKPKK